MGMEWASRLTLEHLQKIEEHLDKGYPEYVVASLVGVPYSTWKYWKKQARLVRDTIDEGLKELFDKGILAVDGTPLYFAVSVEGIIVKRFPDTESAVDYCTFKNLGKKATIVDETKAVDRLLDARTQLSIGQDKVLALLSYCEKGKAYTMADHIDNIRQQSKEHWQASAWWAERQDRENFGRYDTVINQNINADITDTLTEEEAQKFKDNLASVFPNLKEK